MLSRRLLVVFPNYVSGLHIGLLLLLGNANLHLAYYVLSGLSRSHVVVLDILNSLSSYDSMTYQTQPK